MYLGVVTGHVVATVKTEGLTGHKLLWVQPIAEDGSPNGIAHAAVDTVQAGIGDRVFLVGSREAALALSPSFVAVDAAIVGIVDGVEVAAQASPTTRVS